MSQKISVLEGSWFEPVLDTKYDVIVSNPPCMPVPSDSDYLTTFEKMALDGGEGGSDAIIRFLSLAKNHLLPDATVFVPVPKWGDWKEIFKYLDGEYNYEIVAGTMVPFFLSNWDSSFSKHLNTLKENGLSDVVTRSGIPFAEVLVVKAGLNEV